MCAGQKPDQRGIRAGSATCAPAHDELSAFPDPLQLGGDGEDDGLCPASVVAVGLTIAFDVPLEEFAEPRRNDMESDALAPNVNAGDQGAGDATLFV